MASTIYIPRPVKDSIRAHLESSVDEAVATFLSANEDEDTLTGHLGGKLQVRNQQVTVLEDEIPGTWAWSIDYYKFRGRGKDATEKFLGADGIVQIVLERPGRIETKSILFQAKVDWESDSDLVNQCIKLSTWREAAFVLNYTPERFEAYSLDQVLRAQGSRRNAGDAATLQNFLADRFLECKVGNTDLQYDAQARRLIWRAANGEFVATDFLIGHRIRVKIRPPAVRRNIREGIDKIVSNDQIHEYRMYTTAEDVLASYPRGRAISSLRKEIALTFHPDRFNVAELLKAALTRRMQEFNHALDERERRERQ